MKLTSIYQRLIFCWMSEKHNQDLTTLKLAYFIYLIHMSVMSETALKKINLKKSPQKDQLTSKCYTQQINA